MWPGRRRLNSRILNSGSGAVVAVVDLISGVCLDYGCEYRRGGDEIDSGRHPHDPRRRRPGSDGN